MWTSGAGASRPAGRTSHPCTRSPRPPSKWNSSISGNVHVCERLTGEGGQVGDRRPSTITNSGGDVIESKFATIRPSSSPPDRTGCPGPADPLSDLRLRVESPQRLPAGRPRQPATTVSPTIQLEGLRSHPSVSSIPRPVGSLDSCQSDAIGVEMRSIGPAVHQVSRRRRVARSRDVAGHVGRELGRVAGVDIADREQRPSQLAVGRRRYVETRRHLGPVRRDVHVVGRDRGVVPSHPPRETSGSGRPGRPPGSRRDGDTSRRSATDPSSGTPRRRPGRCLRRCQLVPFASRVVECRTVGIHVADHEEAGGVWEPPHSDDSQREVGESLGLATGGGDDVKLRARVHGTEKRQAPAVRTEPWLGSRRVRAGQRSGIGPVEGHSPQARRTWSRFHWMDRHRYDDDTRCGMGGSHSGDGPKAVWRREEKTWHSNVLPSRCPGTVHPPLSSASVRSLTVLTSGGDAPGMNAAIQAVVKIGAARDST
jgi:hypothetical protein